LNDASLIVPRIEFFKAMLQLCKLDVPGPDALGSFFLKQRINHLVCKDRYNFKALIGNARQRLFYVPFVLLCKQYLYDCCILFIESCVVEGLG